MASKSKKIKKSNILLVGPTGSGKTLIAQTIAKRLDVPFVIADATSYTQSGYVGKDVDEILTSLLHAANNNVKRAERGIVYIDEVDKIARKTAGGAAYSRDPSGEGVQQALLKIMEGTTLQIPVNTGNSMFVETVEFNTNNVLFICGGAFEGLKDTEMTVSGFCLTDDSKPIRSKEKVTPDALKKYGMIPELIGRLPIIVQLSALGEEDLIHVMRDTKDSILKEYMTLFSMDGIKLTFAKSALEEIAKLAIELKTGARGIRSIIEDTMLEMMYNLPSQKNVAEVLVTKETIYTKRGKLRYKNEVNADFGV